MTKDDYQVIRSLLIGEVTNARAASVGARVQEINGVIKRLDENNAPKGKKTKLIESEVKNG